jgi:hypothetical protein
MCLFLGCDCECFDTKLKHLDKRFEAFVLHFGGPLKCFLDADLGLRKFTF